MWVALSQLHARWLPHVAGRTGSRRIRCGSAQSGQACEKGPDWPAAREHSDPLRPHRREGLRVKEKPYWILGRAGKCLTVCPKGTAVGQGLVGGEVSTWWPTSGTSRLRWSKGATRTKKGAGLTPGFLARRRRQSSARRAGTEEDTAARR
jgi:hypothetical protein